MNIITITGNVGKDIEIRSMANGDPVGAFSVADSQGKDKPTIWWYCDLWGKRATALQQYIVKGQQVTVAGNVTEREWTDKEGQTRKTMSIRVIDIALQGGKREGGQQSTSYAPAQRIRPTGCSTAVQSTSYAPAQAVPQQRPAPQPIARNDLEDMDSDIPF